MGLFKKNDKKGRRRAKKTRPYPGGHNLMEKMDKAQKKGRGPAEGGRG